MEEKIGKVILDTTCYPGKDLYSDGAIEDEMLAISRDFAPEEFNRVISERKSWPILYHFSHIRENILSWIPFTGEEKVLEIGSGCGAVTGALCERVKEVTCIELSMKRSKINAYRHQDQDNLKILVLTIFLQYLFDSTMFGIVHHDIDFLSVIIKERNAYFPVSHMGANHNHSLFTVQQLQKLRILLEFELILIYFSITDGYLVNQDLS